MNVLKEGEGLSVNQAAWAEQHDWFISLKLLGRDTNNTKRYAVTVRPAYEGDTQTEFSDYRALREWAGY